MLEELAEEEFVLEFVKSVRKKDPGLGGHKLWLMYRSEFGEANSMGHCRFEKTISKYGLCLRRRNSKPRTTDSRHGLPTYPNKIKDVIPDHPNQIWVSDITYQKIWLNASKTEYRFCYISLITDCYTKEIIGKAVGDTLSAEHPIKALEEALKRIEGTSLHPTHHSDRGIQYVSSPYVKLLLDNGLEISMTECGNPKDNAVAERVNNTVKNELFVGMDFFSTEQVRKKLDEAVDFYNNYRPHLSIGLMTPAEAALQSGELRKYWTSYRENHLKGDDRRQK